MEADQDDVICRDIIKPRKLRSQNIVDKLRNREHFGTRNPG